MLNKVFSLLNFAIFLGALIYFFKKYLIKDIRARLHHRQDFRSSLSKNLDLIQQQSFKLNQESQVQEKLYHNLRLKVMHWKAKSAEFIVEKEKEVNQALEQAQARRKQQLLQWQETKILKSLVPLALQDAQEELQKNFIDLQQAEYYNQRILESLPKN
ncbi:MAG TPA: hypothetical protein VHA52_06200 [Candidatus Babeliaceae bacterium]|nr:hypothetical protein [Candidatus Babeliaceae bacterium]